MLSLQGHDNWVRSLDFATFTKGGEEAAPQDASETTKGPTTTHHHTLQEGDLLLASASQDKYVRLWRISAVDTSQTAQGDASGHDNDTKTGSEGGNLTQDMLKSLEEMSKSGTQLSTKAHVIDVVLGSAETRRFSVMFEALLLGHDDWVYTINWQPPTHLNGKYHQPMCLLSASTDKSMMIWRPDESTGVWVNSTQVGEVGGNTIGFYGGLFGPDGRWIMAYGYNGAFHIWKNEGNEIGGKGKLQKILSLGLTCCKALIQGLSSFHVTFFTNTVLNGNVFPRPMGAPGASQWTLRFSAGSNLGPNSIVSGVSFS